MKPSTSAALPAETARAYQALCSLCSWAFLSDPDEERLRALTRDRSMFAEPPFSQVAPEAAAELAEALAPFADEGAADAAFSALRRDRTYLFYMTGESLTSPYESVYRTDDATMFGPTTLEVREAYRAHGLRYERADKEPDDHIGLELAFAAHLLECAAGALEADGRARPAAFDELASFLSDHLLVFAPLYLGNVRLRAKTGFYRGAAGIAKGTIEALSGALGAEPSESVGNARFNLADRL